MHAELDRLLDAQGGVVTSAQALTHLSRRGLEADFSGQLSTHWRLNASASYTDATLTRDQTLEVGGRVQ